jgi:hypothetical protein
MFITDLREDDLRRTQPAGEDDLPRTQPAGEDDLRSASAG